MYTGHRSFILETAVVLQAALLLLSSCTKSRDVTTPSGNDDPRTTSLDRDTDSLADVGTDTGSDTDSFSDVGTDTSGDTQSESLDTSSKMDTAPVVLERIPHPLSTGTSHTCYIDAQGDVWCFGSNDRGQLGNGDNHASFEPVEVQGLGESAVSVASGGAHTCALLNSGIVVCWGANTFGQLGQETDCNDAPFNMCESWRPLKVPNLSDDIVAIGAGEVHTCAVAVDGGVKCWGANGQGQLGIGPIEPESSYFTVTPTEVVNLGRGARAVALGNWHTCAILVDGGVACWGSNNKHLLGIADCEGCDFGEPQRVFEGDAVSVDTGKSHTCIALTNGDVVCFGESSFGEAGERPTAAVWVPTPTRLDASTEFVTDISLGDGFSCLLEESGRVRCFGYNRYGQAGIGLMSLEAPLDEAARIAEPAVAVEAGERHACALLESGGIQCWGSNQRGQLGDGTGGRPMKMALDTAVESVFAGFNTCVKTTTGEIWCAGITCAADENDAGSIDYTFSNIPVLMEGVPLDVTSLDEGHSHTCVQTVDQEVCCFGDNSYSQVGQTAVAYQDECQPVTDLLPGTAAIAAGENMSLALSDTGQIQSWGRYVWDYYVGDFGVYSHVVTAPMPPALAENISDATSISTGDDFSCAIRANGGIRCAEHRPELLSFVDVTGLPDDLSTVAVGDTHACVIDGDGDVWCLGDNSFGQLGNGESCEGTDAGCPNWRFPDSPVNPVEIPDTPVIALSSGGKHSCALTESGAVFCWGSNSSGQIGLGPSSNREPSPVLVPGLESDVVEIACGLRHTCARKNDGTVLCFGDNENGELGNGRFSYSTLPVNVLNQ